MTMEKEEKERGVRFELCQIPKDMKLGEFFKPLEGLSFGEKLKWLDDHDYKYTILPPKYKE